MRVLEASSTTTADQTELVVALVAAVGTNIGLVGDQVATQLSEYGYTTMPLRLSDYLAEQAKTPFRGKKFDEELWDAMSAGDELRQSWKRNDALALHAISDIVATREAAVTPTGGADDDDELPPNLYRHAFILRSLKTPQELETLRAVYGDRLIVIAAYSPRDLRLDHLAKLIEDSRKSADRSTWVHQPEDLIDRDEKEEDVGGQDLTGTFHRADFFIRGWNRDVIVEDLKRTLEILFGFPFRSPTRDEQGQFLAAGAALRSTEFGRQVGAAIATREGSIIAVGANEVPTAGGGSHWEEDGKGNRDFEVGDIDTNRRHFDDLAKRLSAEVDQRMARIAEDLTPENSLERNGMELLRRTLLESLVADLRKGGLKDLTEFGRAVHAEMHALLDAARRGVPVREATLYTTTFPCHNCARHIIGAGVGRVVFIEPYAKSRAGQLHEESLTIDEAPGDGRRLLFEPFVGVAPRRYLQMFDAAARVRLGHTPRSDASGAKVPWTKAEASPVFTDSAPAPFRPEIHEYRVRELLALEYFDEQAQQEQDPSAASETIPPSEATDG